MKIFVLNAGSSSLKFQLFDIWTKTVLASGIAERVWSESSFIKYQTITAPKTTVQESFPDHKSALQSIFHILVNGSVGVIQSFSEITAVGHRVVHGGEMFQESVMITDEILEKIKGLSHLAPLHQPANIMGIEACIELLPHAKNVAVFDTAFHQTMPAEAYIYALPYELYEKHAIRRYGFHGTSHKYVSTRAAEILGKDIKDLKCITCHVGNGASIAAIDGGKVQDTSMGFTPLEGLVMGTRSGDIDPAIVSFVMSKENISASEMEHILNKKSGVLGISGVSNDMREIEDGKIAGKPRESLAYDVYMRRIVKYIGGYALLLGGVDAVILTGGVFENSSYMRKDLAERIASLGITFLSENNNFRGEERILSSEDSRTVLLAIPTNEELVIAEDTYALIK